MRIMKTLFFKIIFMGINFIFCIKKTRNINYRIKIFKKGLEKYEKIFSNSELIRTYHFILGNN